MFSKVGQKVNTFFFYSKSNVINIAQKAPDIWATIVRIFFTRNFQKSPNLVTLPVSYGACCFVHILRST